MNLVTMHYPLLSDCPSTLEGQSFSNTLTHLVESMLVFFFKTAYSSDTLFHEHCFKQVHRLCPYPYQYPGEEVLVTSPLFFKVKGWAIQYMHVT